MSTAIGRAAEEDAAQYIKQHGYKIIARNRRLGRGELDIIATKGDILAFVEVRQRESIELALESVTKQKQRRLVSAALSFLALNHQYADMQCRFDLMICLSASKKLIYEIDIFRP
ncbi:MAG: YraN family protein [Mariprofundales bacterium]